MSRKNSKISPFAYTDYRLFLEAFYIEEKANNRLFSYRYFGEKTGVSPSLLKDVISGRRNLSIDVMKKYATFMELTTRELRYFKLLVVFAHSKNNAEKNDCFIEMIRLRGQSGVKFIGQNHYEFFSKWYHSAIRELITMPHFVEDYQWIGKQLEPSITAKEAKEAINFLLNIDILKRDNNGQLIQSNAIISSEYEMASAALRTFHSQMIGLAKRSIEEISIENREVSSLTVGISKNQLRRIKERIRIFKEELLAGIVEDKSDSELVCQINFQLFPLVKDVNDSILGDSNE